MQGVGLALDFLGGWDLEFDDLGMVDFRLLWPHIGEYELLVLNLFFGGKAIVDDLVVIGLFWPFLGGLLLHRY